VCAHYYYYSGSLLTLNSLSLSLSLCRSGVSVCCARGSADHHINGNIIIYIYIVRPLLGSVNPSLSCIRVCSSDNNDV